MATGTESKGWWATMPGILTALAGLVTAVAGLLVALHQIGALGGEAESVDSPSNSTEDSTPSPVPAGSPMPEGDPFGAVTYAPVGPDGPGAGTPGAAVLTFYDALWANDESTLRAVLDPESDLDLAALRFTRSQASTLNHMADQLDALFDPEGTSASEPVPETEMNVRVEGVWRSGRRARVLVADESGAQHTVDLVRHGDGWKILRLGGAS